MARSIIIRETTRRKGSPQMWAMSMMSSSTVRRSSAGKVRPYKNCSRALQVRISSGRRASHMGAIQHHKASFFPAIQVSSPALTFVLPGTCQN